MQSLLLVPAVITLIFFMFTTSEILNVVKCTKPLEMLRKVEI